MRYVTACVVCALAAAAINAGRARDDFNPDDIIRLERAALDRWGKGDPDGYFDIMAPEETYFDPTTERRIDGREALKAMIEPLRGKISIDRAELLNPNVQRDGNVAVLTFNLISRGGSLAGAPKTDVYWNATETYRRINGRWQIVHSHWSYTKSLPQPR